jgi:parvulin-like peptidyl-prolyl isomerase
VMAMYNNIPADTRTNTSLQESLDQAVNNKLLTQDAAAKELIVSEDEVDNAIGTFLTNNGLTLQQLEESLTAAGSTLAQFRTNTRNNLLLQKEINEVTKDAIEPAEAEIQKYYDDNKQTFITKASAQTRQLLIYSNESNDAEKLAQIKGISTMLNATNFCELVSLYSQDNASISRCGEYDFTQGELLPEYEQVVFSSEPGSAKITKTRIGYHIIEILNVTLPQEISFSQAKDSIANYLLLINKQDLLNQHIAQLRQNAEIVSYI